MQSKAIILITSLTTFFLFLTSNVLAKVNSKAGEMHQLEQHVHAEPNVLKNNAQLPLEAFKTLKPSAPVGEVIGITTYDLQTNSGMSRRIAAHPNNRWFYAGWTMGRDFTAGPPNRGTGFNLYDNQSAMWLPQPDVRLEPSNRTGWPSIGFSQGRQFSISHTTSQGILFTWRPGTTNTNDWMEVEVGVLVNDNDGLWARTAAAGSNIYIIASRNAYSGVAFGGILGGLNFIISKDNGITWESLGSLEADYSNSIAGSMSADNYAIDATLDVVSVIIGGGISEIILYKSTNQAESWEKSVIQKSSNSLVQNLNPDYNYGEGDFTVDPFFGSNGNTVIIDSEAKSHVVFSGRIVYNNSSNNFNETFNYFIDNRACGLFYWNEDMENPEIIGKTVMNDADGNGKLGSDILALQNGGQPYYSGFVCQPQLGIDDEDNLYVSYTANVDGDFVPSEVTYLSLESGGGEVLPYTQNFQPNTITFTDVFMIKSTDGGNNWQGPLNVTSAADSEETYASIPRNIGDTIMLIYMHDPLPGILLRSNQEMATINEIAAVKILPEEINDSAAPPDSEPYFTAPNLTQTGNNFFMPQGCSLKNEEYFRHFAFGMDYPDGIIKEFQAAGLADYSTPGFYTEGIFVEDSQGNISDTAYYNIEVLPDTEAPVMEFDNCTEFSIVLGQQYTLSMPVITDYFIFDGQVEESGCDVSENLEITDNIDIQTVGSYKATYTVSDFAGNSTTSEITINVIESDVTGPIITVTGLPESISLLDLDMLPAITFSAIDNIACEEVDVIMEGLEELKNATMGGDYIITFTAVDANGNETVETFTVEVTNLSTSNNFCENATFLELSPKSNCELVEIDLTYNNTDIHSDGCLNGSAPDMYFKIVVPPHGQIKFSTDGRSFAAIVYEDCNSVALNCMYVSDYGGEVFLMRDLPPNDTLILEIASFSNTTLCVENATPDVNDKCENASPIELTDRENCFSPDFGTTTGAGVTIEDLEYNDFDKPTSCETNEYLVDLFYEFVAPPSGYIKIDMNGGFVAVIYDSCLYNELYCKIGNVAIGSLNAGETYILQLAIFNFPWLDDSDFKFCVTEALPTENNDCENAIFIDVYEPQDCGEDVIPLDFSDNTLNLDYQVCATGDMFYKFVVPENGIVRIGGFLNSKEPSPQFGIYQNCSTDPLFILNCINSPTGIIQDLPPFDTLLLQLAGNRGIDYKFCLQKSIPTPNNNCSNAAFIEVLPFGSALNGKVFNYNNVLNTTVICEPALANAFYEFVVPPAGEVVFLNTIGSTSINLSNGCDDLYPFYIECEIEETQAITNLTPGDTLLMEIETPASNLEFDFGIQEIKPSPNNNCANATMLNVVAPGECLENSVSVNLTYNTSDLESSCFSSEADAYYAFIVPESGRIKINSTSFYNALYNACDGEEIFCSSNASNIADLTPGDTVILKIARFVSFFGQIPFVVNEVNFCLEEAIPTANNECNNATLIEVGPVNDCNSVNIDLSSNNIDKPNSCKPDSYTADAFFQYTVPPSGFVKIAAKSFPHLTAYTACDGEELFCYEGGIGTVSRVLPYAEPGSNTLLQISYTNTAINFCIEEAIPQANNTCENAEWLTVQPDATCLETTTLNLENNTLDKQVDCFDLVTSDAFYKFIVPPSGQISLDEPDYYSDFSIQVFESCSSQAIYCSSNLLYFDQYVSNLNPGDTLLLQINAFYPRNSEFCIYETCMFAIEGSVTGEADCDVSRIPVLIRNENGELMERLITDEYGNYRSASIYECGIYLVELDILPFIFSCYNGNTGPISFELNEQRNGVDFIDLTCVPPQTGTFNCEE